MPTKLLMVTGHLWFWHTRDPLTQLFICWNLFFKSITRSLNNVVAINYSINILAQSWMFPYFQFVKPGFCPIVTVHLNAAVADILLGVRDLRKLQYFNGLHWWANKTKRCEIYCNPFLYTSYPKCIKDLPYIN